MMRIVLFIFCICGWACQPSTTANAIEGKQEKGMTTTVITVPYDTATTTIHLYVALCDNTYQGIVPVLAAIGNGQNLSSNLYWGCGYGVRSYFKKSSQWKLVKQYTVDSVVLERLVFKHSQYNAYLIADAYNGKFIQQCTVDFLKSCAGERKDTLQLPQRVIGSSGNASLVVYVGHDGLMDFKLTDTFRSADNRKRDAMILACYSRNFFWTHLRYTHATPLVWTTGLMCPEAYTLHDAIEAYLKKAPPENICNSAAAAYARYQKCSVKAAKGLLVSGW